MNEDEIREIFLKFFKNIDDNSPKNEDVYCIRRSGEFLYKPAWFDMGNGIITYQEADWLFDEFEEYTGVKFP